MASAAAGSVRRTCPCGGVRGFGPVTPFPLTRADDIVNVLESLEVVEKGASGRYTWCGMMHLPGCVARLEAEWAAPGAKPLVVLLAEDDSSGKVRPAHLAPSRLPASRLRRAASLARASQAPSLPSPSRG